MCSLKACGHLPFTPPQPAKLLTIGLLVAGTPASRGRWTDGFVDQPHELGWVESRTIAIDYRWAEGRDDRAGEIAAELVQRKVDIIVTSGYSPAPTR